MRKKAEVRFVPVVVRTTTTPDGAVVYRLRLARRVEPRQRHEPHAGRELAPALAAHQHRSMGIATGHHRTLRERE
jgi:hypothetical protein